MVAIKKNYTLSNPELCQLVSNMVTYMTRDTVELANRGVDTAEITAYQALGNAFEVFPSDDEYKGLITIEVDEKTILYNKVFDQIQLISGFLEQKWGIRSGQYKRLGISNLRNLRETEFLFRSRAVARIATEYLSDLTAEGLTQSMIDILEADAQLYEDKMNDVAYAKAQRDTKANERVIKGNELYTYVVKYATIGKLIWENIDDAKYNDYIIYRTTHSGLSKPQNLALVYDPLEPALLTLSWDLVIDATAYDVYVNIAATGAPSGTFNLLNTFPTSPALLPVSFDKRNYFKIKAKNDNGSSPYSNEIFYDVPPAP